MPRKAYSANLAIPMSDLNRIGVAIDAILLKKIDHFIASHASTNHSEAFRVAIRGELIDKIWERPDALVECAANGRLTITSTFAEL